jgi:hypothetical protein
LPGLLSQDNQEIDEEFRRQEAAWKRTEEYRKFVGLIQELKDRTTSSIRNVMAMGCGSLHNNRVKDLDSDTWMKSSSALNLARVLTIAEILGGEMLHFNSYMAKLC